MPEGPEVKIVTEILDNSIRSYDITNCKIIGGRYLRHGNPINYDRFLANLPIKVNKIYSKGKGIFFELEKNWYIYNTLGMTGQYSSIKDKYSTIEFTFKKKKNLRYTDKILNVCKKLYFRDIRNFGTFKFINDISEYNYELNKLGPDLLDINTTTAIFIEKIKKHKNKNITKVLMNQSIISGIGNYIKSESLYKTKISPYNIINDIPDEILNALFNNIRDIMFSSYKIQSSNNKYYYNFQSGKGDFYKILNVYRKNYDIYGNIVTSEKTEDGRTTHWVKNLQLLFNINNHNC